MASHGSKESEPESFEQRYFAPILALILTVGIASTWYFSHSAIFDDAFITYRYAQNLATGEGLVFNPGERVLGTTTPLYALLLGLIALPLCAEGSTIPIASSLIWVLALGTIAGLGAILLMRRSLAAAGLLFASIVLADFGSARGYFGMETALYGALLFLALWAFVNDRPTLAGVAIGLATLTRFDAIVFALCLLVVAVFVDRGGHAPDELRPRLTVPWRSIWVALAIVVPWLVFSWLYFGALLPNTLHAKGGTSSLMSYLELSAVRQAERAYAFLRSGPLSLPPLFVGLTLVGSIAALGAGTRRLLEREPRWIPALLFPFALWLAYSQIGPPVGHGWHLLPAAWMLLFISIGAFQLAIGEALADASRTLARRLGVVMTILALALTAKHVLSVEQWHSRAQERNGRGRNAVNEEIARFLNAVGLDGRSILTHEPGYLAFLSKSPVIDAAGLVTPGISFHQRESRSSLEQLIVDREPDMVLPLAGQSLTFQPEGYVPILNSFSTRKLFLRSDLVGHHWPELLAWIEGRSDLGLWSPLAPSHTLSAEMDEDSVATWRQSGGWIPLGAQAPDERWDGVSLVRASSDRKRGGLESPAVAIDFDEIRLRFSAPSPGLNSAQLVVNGRVVLEAMGRTADASTLREVVWPVVWWRGQPARVRFPNRSPERPLLVDWIRTSEWPQRQLLEDFEDAKLGTRHWSGFLGRTTEVVSLVAEYGVGVATSRRAATSFDLEGPQTLISPDLDLPMTALAFQFFDFCKRACEVRLEDVDEGSVIARIRGRGANRVRPVRWQLEGPEVPEVRLVVEDKNPRPLQFVGIDNLIAFEADAD